MKPYPIFLIQLAKRHCVVIGGGREAEYKISGLLDCEATITVISPTLTPQLQALADNGTFTWLQRPYQAGDLRGAFLAIAERHDPQKNAQIWQEAQAEGILVNVMDDVAHCNFVAGSVVRQGKLVAAISTSGAAPALSVRLRQQLENKFGPEYVIFLDWMQALRPKIAARFPDFQERRQIWYQLVDSDLLQLLQNGRTDLAQQRIADITEIDLSVDNSVHEIEKRKE